MMTVSPDFKTFFLSFPVYCSAIKGETLALIAPAPRPMMKMATTKPPREASGCLRAAGAAVPVRIA